MNKGNPAVTAAAGGIGVFLASILTGKDPVGSVLAGAITGGLVYAILWYMARRKG